MGCLKLSYYDQEKDLEVNPKFYMRAVEKNGLLEKNRLSSSTYGFNGKEKDDEIKGNGNSLDFGARIYDPRLGRWLAVDPLASKYPFASSYNFALNTPIQAYDPDGKIVIYASPESQAAVKLAMKNDPKFAKTIIKLQKSDVVYNYVFDGVADFNEGSESEDMLAGGVSSNGEQIDIHYNKIINSHSLGENSSLYHETEHAVQFEHGEVGFKKNEEGDWVLDETYDVTDEVKGFEAGLEAPGVKSVFKVNFKKKSDFAKENKIGRNYPSLNKRKNIDRAAGNKTRRDRQSAPNKKSYLIKTKNVFYKTKTER
ncbi:MAG: hypothetical protein HRT71_01675 [Flavobacteriales bacterium]|nr:hypothetical protein [Flavobacteriales bacterium]